MIQVINKRTNFLTASTLDMIPYDPEATVLEKIRKNEAQRLMAVTSLCSVLIYLYEGMMVSSMKDTFNQVTQK